MVIFIIGGARSGKSHYAETLAKHYGTDAVSVVVTLEPLDQEMAQRIQRHKNSRPPPWSTIEAPHDLIKGVGKATTNTVLIDCVSGWLANLLLIHESLGEAALAVHLKQEVKQLAHHLRTLSHAGKTVIIISSETGLGVIPPYPLGRWYRDALGQANQTLAALADVVALVIVGLPQPLKGQLPSIDLT